MADDGRPPMTVGTRSKGKQIHHENTKQENQRRFARSAFIVGFVFFVSSW
jgi:hypothetical protein